MEKNIDDFLEEITTNFSELFVETFFIRYVNEFGKKDIIKNSLIVQNMLNIKLNNLIKSKVNLIEKKHF